MIRMLKKNKHNSRLFLFCCALPAVCLALDEASLAAPASKIRFNGDARPELREGWDAFVNVAYLYWWTDVDDIAVAEKMEGNKGKALNPEVRPDTGFKLGVGAYLPHDGWDFTLNLTHLHSRAPIHAEGELTPLWTIPVAGGGAAESLRAHWRLHFALLDFELGRNFYLSRHLTLRPHIGLRYAIVRQKYLIHCMGGTLYPDGQDYVSMKNKFLAPGVRAGLDLGWKIARGFGLYSNLAASVQYGQVYVHVSEKVSFEEEKRMNIFDKFIMAKPILDLAAGVEWEAFLFHDRYQLLLQAGWESHLLFAQNQLFHFVSSSGGFGNVHGNLSVQGLTFSLSFGY